MEVMAAGTVVVVSEHLCVAAEQTHGVSTGVSTGVGLDILLQVAAKVQLSTSCSSHSVLGVSSLAGSSCATPVQPTAQGTSRAMLEAAEWWCRMVRSDWRFWS